MRETRPASFMVRLCLILIALPLTALPSIAAEL
jgi:hypothetical protein